MSVCVSVTGQLQFFTVLIWRLQLYNFTSKKLSTLNFIVTKILQKTNKTYNIRKPFQKRADKTDASVD